MGPELYRGLGLKTALTPPVARTLNSWLLLCPWGSTPLFSLLWTLSASCHKEGALFYSLWSPRGRDGRVILAQGRARLPLGLKDKPTD